MSSAGDVSNELASLHLTNRRKDNTAHIYTASITGSITSKNHQVTLK